MQRNAPGRVYIFNHADVPWGSGSQQAPQEVEFSQNEEKQHCATVLRKVICRLLCRQEDAALGVKWQHENH